MKVSIIVPTRKRKDNIDRLIDGLIPLLNENTVELVIGIDVDDDSYDIDFIKTKAKNILVVRTPTTPYLSNIYNILVWYATGNIIGYFADDICFIDLSIFYDIIEKFKQCEIMLYTTFEESVAVHGFVSKKSIELLGFLFMPCIEHGYLDHQLTMLYKNIERYYYNPVNFFVHLHWHAVPSLLDEIYIKKSIEKDENGTTCDDRDLIKFNQYKKLYLETHTNLLKSNLR